jgi:linoleoyl-CoA desaturase
MTLSKLVTDFSQLKGFNNSGITKEQGADPLKERRKLYLSKLVYLSIIIGFPLWMTDFKWWQVLTGFCIMHITAGIIMSTVFQTAHVVEITEQPLPDVNGIIHTEWAVHQLRTTSDFARHNRLLSWYIGGLNFQIEHHLFTNICHIHYPKIAPIVEETAKQFGLPYLYHRNFRSALSSHVKKLKALGRN